MRQSLKFRKLLNSELGRITAQEYDLSPKTGVVLVLDNIRSQHNIGAAFRSADAFMVEKIYLCGICATPPSPEIHKSALGAEETISWEYHKNTKELIKLLKEQGYIILSIEQTENSVMLNDILPESTSRYALIFGNEVKGVSQEVVDMSDMVLEIPQYGTKHSLNVSVSIGIALWEITKKLHPGNR